MSTDEIAPAREHTDQFRLLVESVVDYAIFLLDPAGYVRSWNMGAERIKGYTADEIIGKHFSVFYPPDDRERGVPQSVLGIARDEGRFEGEGWRIRKDGARFWANVVITALHDDTGELVGFAKVTRDLTERKSADEQRLSLVQAEQAARSAEEAVAVRDEFVRIAAHELNTPLTGAKIGLQLLQRSLRDGELTPSQTLALDTLGTQINKLIHLVGELLDATRMEAGALRLEPTEVDLAELVRRLAEQWRALTQEHEIVVACSERLVARVGATRIEEVLTNLLDNAVKYSPGGGRIEIDLVEKSGGVTISVRDHGIGVQPADRPKLFGRFFRAHSDRSGMGLGLHITRRFVELHGGTISAEFPDDGGTRFVVSLPM